ncbi:MAG: MATE family efflux transporter [Hyphomicrobiaceae bacterium]
MSRTADDPGANLGALLAPVPSYWHEVRRLLALAIPLIGAYVSEYAIVLTNKAIIGQLGYRELAAVGLANDLAMQIQIVLVGMISVVGVLVAQAEGRGHKADAGIAVRQGFVIVTLVGLPAALLIWHLDSILILTGVAPELVQLMGPFLLPASAALLPILFYFVLRMFVAAVARTGVIMLLTVVAVGLNYFVCSTLVHGKYGFPALGPAGAGWSKLVVALFLLTALLTFVYFNPKLRGYGIFRGRLKLDLGVCREIAWLGLPVAGIVIMEAGLFSSVSVLSGILGPVPLATYQVMIAWIGIAFMTAHGLAEAGMVRVAWGAGKDSLVHARRSGLAAMAVGSVWLILLMAAPLSFPETLVRLFLSPTDEGFAKVLALVSKLLVLAAFFQVFDGLQVIASLTLRGLKDTVVPLWFAAFGYWFLGVGGGYVLAFPLEFGADGLWWGMALGLTVTGSLLAWRFVVLTRI